MTVGNTRNF